MTVPNNVCNIISCVIIYTTLYTDTLKAVVAASSLANLFGTAGTPFASIIGLFDGLSH